MRVTRAGLPKKKQEQIVTTGVIVWATGCKPTGGTGLWTQIRGAFAKLQQTLPEPSERIAALVKDVS